MALLHEVFEALQAEQCVAKGVNSMKFGVLQFFSWPGRRGDLKDVYDRATERVHIMDQNPYDCVWIAEHHFGNYSMCPSPLVLASHLAGLTSKIRLGPAVLVLPLYHPLRVLGELGMVDQLSDGRLRVLWALSARRRRP